MLIDELKKAQMEALKTKDTLKRSVLQIVTGKVKLAEIEKRSKNESLTDDDVLLVINKVIKELDEEILAFKNANRLEKVEELTKQKQILEAYLPAKLTEEGKLLLKEWGIPESYKGIGNCILGYPKDKPAVLPKPRKENYVIYK